jgi:hypothetical protein
MLAEQVLLLLRKLKRKLMSVCCCHNKPKADRQQWPCCVCMPSVTLLLQYLRKLELFSGGGGLSFMSQQDNGVGIVSCWANDFNPSACATYVCNRPYTYVSTLCRSRPAAVNCVGMMMMCLYERIFLNVG